MGRVAQLLLLVAALCLSAIAQNRDTYGGLTDITVPGCNPATAYFTVQLIQPSNHWEYVDPLCHPFMRFGVDLTGTSGYAQNVYSTRYTDLQHWYTHTAQRMQNYNFNEWGDYSDETAAGQGPLPGTNPIPQTVFMRPIGYALYNLSDCSNSTRTYPSGVNLKDFQAQDGSGNPLYLSSTVWNTPGWNFHPGPTPSNPGAGQTPDVMDPYVIGDCTDWQLSVAKSFFPSHDFYNNRNVVDISMEDMDFVYSWRGIGADGYPHTGFLAAVVNPYVAAGGGTGTTFWSKAVWACGGWQHSAPGTCDGTSYLELHYGSVAAVCTSWGKSPCPWTTFGSTGAWGTGTGLMDEDGRHVCTDALDLTGCPINFQTDVNNLLYQQVLFAVNTMIAHVQAYDTNHVISTLDFLGGESATSDEIRTPVLLGLRDSNAQVLHLVFSTARVAGTSAQAQNVYNVTHKPIMPWYHVCAPADSPFSGGGGSDGYCGDGSHYATQALRGTAYAANISTMYHLQGSDNKYPLMGMNWWAWSDPCNPSTPSSSCPLNVQEWGLVTWNDNIYNGICAVIGASTDPWGYPCGGEAGNYGDFLDAASNANTSTMKQFITDNSGSGGSGQVKTTGKVTFSGRVKM